MDNSECDADCEAMIKLATSMSLSNLIEIPFPCSYYTLACTNGLATIIAETAGGQSFGWMRKRQITLSRLPHLGSLFSAHQQTPKRMNVWASPHRCYISVQTWLNRRIFITAAEMFSPQRWLIIAPTDKPNAHNPPPIVRIPHKVLAGLGKHIVEWKGRPGIPLLFKIISH